MSTSGPPPTLDTLTDAQRDALSQFTVVTGADVSVAIPLLHRSQWNLEIAITKFFDGERPDPVAEAMSNAAAAAAAPPAPRPPTTRPRHLIPAPRLPPLTAPTPRPLPLPLQILFYPLTLTYRLLSPLLSLLSSLLPILRRPARTRAPQNPIDTARSFIRTITDTHPGVSLPWQETGYTAALDTAKQTLQFLLIVLVSPQHDSYASVGGVLGDARVAALLRDSNVLLWGGDVGEAEAYQVAAALGCTTFPFVGVIAHTAQGMAVVGRVQGAAVTAAAVVRKVGAALDAYSPDIDRIRAQRAAQEADRAIRRMQEEAYEASLAADRAKAEKRREEERRREEIEMGELKRERWRRWRRAGLREEPEAGEGVARVSVRLVDGTRVVRRFRKDWGIEEVYAFVETYGMEKEEGVEKPEGYTHEYRFRVCGVMPRKEFAVDEGTIGECGLWPSGNLVVEELDEESDEE